MMHKATPWFPVFAILVTSASALVCNLLSGKCACSQQSGKFYLDCPPNGDDKIQITAMDGVIELDCNNVLGYVGLLPELQLGNAIDYFGMSNCELLSVPIKRTMEALGVVTADKFCVTASNMTNLSRLDLYSLSATTKLELSSCNLGKLPNDLLYDLHNLTSINLRDNRVVLTSDFFAKNPQLENIELGHNEMAQIPAGLFRNLRQLTSLSLWTNNLSVIDPDAFEDLEQLEILDLLDNQLESLPSGLFRNMPNLRVLSLRKNKFRTLPAGLLDNNSQLEDLRLSDNCFLNVIPGWFLANKSQLHYVSFANCNLTFLPVTIFYGTTSLKVLDLTNNNLKVLQRGLFDETGELEELYLAGNQLQQLEDRIFAKLKALRLLRLEYNQLQLHEDSFFGLKNLEELHMSHNQFTSLSEDVFKHFTSLQTIDLSNNELTLVSGLQDTSRYSILNNLVTLEKAYLNNNNVSEMFGDWSLVLTSLQELRLDHNHINTLSFDDINFVQEGIHVDLRHNQINRIDLIATEVITAQNDFQRVPAQIELNYNPLNCDCYIYDLLRYVEGSMKPSVYNIINLRTDNLTCASPDDLRGVVINQMKTKSLVCILDDGPTMPKGCKQTFYSFRPIDNTFIMDCSYGHLTEMPKIANFSYKNVNIEVHLQGNKLKSLSRDNSYDKVVYLDMSYNLIGDVQWVPPHIKVLKLDNNNLTTLSSKKLSLLNSTTLTNVTFERNPWECDCDLSSFMMYLQENFKHVSNLYNITCGSDNRTIVSLTKSDLCPLPLQIILALSITVAILGLVVGVIAVLYFRYHQEIKVWLYAHRLCMFCVTEHEIDKEKLYDAFISFSHKDEDFVVNELMPKLEAGPEPYKLCVHFRNWLPGEFISTNIARSIAESRRTVVVLSPSFLESEWGKMEFRTAHLQALTEGRVRVIVIIYGEIGPVGHLEPELKAYLTTNTYIEWGDPWFWEKLRYALPHPPKYSKKIKGDKHDLIRETNTTPLASTPPVDILHFGEPMYGDIKQFNETKHTALNVALVNGALVNNGDARSIV